ncbi:MAG: cytoplasmic protein [Alphaproteobacteria bacterium HGW-Alphaproteobacteria-10]|jgi:uncharacterized membrane protein|nr:MAG: cytoplasmic protein [Alphaproteobacteria bacterium HGW-Alphaproteobacteria-10]
MKPRILLAGESWVSAATHFKGFDQFSSVTFHLGAEPLVAALKERWEVRYMPAHECATAFPLTLSGLQEYDAVILSDLGANTLLLHPDVWLHGRPVPNRVKLLGEYANAGGGLAMIGGYFSFQGINGAARWRGTAVEAALPVACLPVDDRVETPEGFSAVIDAPDHPILHGLTDAPWPVLLGLNETALKPGRALLASTPAAQGGHPLLAVGEYGAGRSLAWMSDLGPHWAPQPFVDWPGYGRFWNQALDWLTQRGA